MRARIGDGLLEGAGQLLRGDDAQRRDPKAAETREMTGRRLVVKSGPLRQGCVMRPFTRVTRSQSGEIRASDRADSKLRYGGTWHLAASARPLEGRLPGPRPLGRLMAAAVRRPRRLAALILLMLRTRREYVVLSGSSAGQALDEYFNQRALGILPRHRFCRGVLLLPQNHEEYLRGRRH